MDLKAKQSFQQLKHALNNVSVLALLDFSKSFELEIDVSNFGMGAIFDAR